MIRVVAIITAKPGRLPEFLEHFRANVPHVKAEKGCIEYMGVVDTEGAGPVQAPIGADTFAVIETWESLEALKAHGSAPHMIDYGRRTKELTAGRAIHVLSPV
jgi:quinol monooxygenase YgiN